MQSAGGGGVSNAQPKTLHRCGCFAGVPRHLRPARAASADGATLVIMLTDPFRHISWQTRHCVTAVPALHVDVRDAGQE